VSGYGTLTAVTDAPPPSPPRHGDEAFDDAEIARITGGRLERSSSRPIHGAAVDSRRIQPGNLFVALPGDRTDGHEHLAAAVEAGAAALLVSRPVPLGSALGDVAVIRVGRPLAALHSLAASWRRRFDPLTVGITGSIGKTSTKEAVAAVLGGRFRTLKNEGNENNEIGLPLTVLRLDRSDEALVLEMGMYVEGEIADLVRIGLPRIGVVTAVQPVHLSRIGSIEAIEHEKGRLVEGLPANGTAILNADDERVLRMAGRTAARVVTYGFADDADVRAEAVGSDGPDGMRFSLRTPAGTQPVSIPLLGRHAVHNALAAAAVGLAAGIDPAGIAAALASAAGAAHRGELIRLGDVTVIDDSYNAAPASMLAALDVLSGLRGRRVAVLGEMLELGEESTEGHLEVGRAAARVADLLIVVGDDPDGDADAMAAGAREAGLEPDRILRVADAEDALDELRPRLVPGDVVLVKASRGIALDVLVEALRRELEP
jgi:UDP-N-acetylmuramoyl-tripeptide--D-alanyl-D-alanine ligase